MLLIDGTHIKCEGLQAHFLSLFVATSTEEAVQSTNIIIVFDFTLHRMLHTTKE